MRNTHSGSALSVRAIAGTHMVALAWDLMCFQRQHLPLPPHLSGLARNVFPEDDNEDNDDAAAATM